MAKVYWDKIYLDKDPDDILKGWVWVEVKVEDIRKFNLAREPITYKEKIKRISPEDIRKMPGRGNLPGGRGGSKRKFSINIDGEIITVRVPKSLTNKAVCFWIKSWAPQGTTVITPSNREISLDGDKLNHGVHFVYFILNSDSSAIKIGMAKNLERRLKSLQTSSPAKLELIRSVQVSSQGEARELEKLLHQKFEHIRITGEWFRAESELIHYIESL
ncbi:MAG: GIY-YIG nuclease family protein [Cyanobacteria bacterium P01_F01_bin.150]